MAQRLVLPVRSQYTECAICQQKPCQRTQPGTLDICDFGVAYYNAGSEILKKRERVTTRDIAANLRHELHRVLMYIVSQADEMEPNLSTRRIDLTRPASRIVGATVILDKFIEMVTGVYDFHPDRSGSAFGSTAQLPLLDTVRRLVDTYSLIKNVRRASRLDFQISLPSDLVVVSMAAAVENLLAVLIDNMWKYSVPDTRAAIRVHAISPELVSLEFRNIGVLLPDDCPIFEKGFQAKQNSEGFGFGLYWATVLVDHCNSAQNRTDAPMALRYEQLKLGADSAEHVFTLENVAARGRQ